MIFMSQAMLQYINSRPVNYLNLVLLHLKLSQRLTIRITSRPSRSVRNMETAIYPRQRIQVHSHNLHAKVDNVKRRFVEVTRQRRSHGHGCKPQRAGAVARTETYKHCACNEDCDFRAQPAPAECVMALLPRYGERNSKNWEREKRDYGQEGGAVELYCAVDEVCSGAESVERLYYCCDEGCESKANNWPEDFEGHGGDVVPAEVRVERAHEALCPDQVDDEDDEDASCGEDLCCNGEADVLSIHY